MIQKGSATGWIDSDFTPKTKTAATISSEHDWKPDFDDSGIYTFNISVVSNEITNFRILELEVLNSHCLAGILHNAGRPHVDNYGTCTRSCTERCRLGIWRPCTTTDPRPGYCATRACGDDNLCGGKCTNCPGGLTCDLATNTCGP